MSRRKKGRTTIADVAARAGVSPITVSRALREPARVSEPLRRRIDAAVGALSYVPDQHARALASARTNVVGAAQMQNQRGRWPRLTAIPGCAIAFLVFRPKGERVFVQHDLEAATAQFGHQIGRAHD